FGVKAAAMALLLKSIDKDYKNNPDIKWNFTKFVIARDGSVAARFEPTNKMEELDKCISALI
ncbi:MAG: glutathione peroxidase, partial [Oscillospiraceae bacterium]|nr:glutathione peroxidase [Oscillospiraceae bacterium]